MDELIDIKKDFRNAKLLYLIAGLIDGQNSSGQNSMIIDRHKARRHVIYVCKKAKLDATPLLAFLDQIIKDLEDHPAPVTHIFNAIILLSNRTRALNNISNCGPII